jgi:hypothetical protein
VNSTGHSLRRLDDGVEQRHPALARREQATDASGESRRVARVVDQDRGPLGQGDERHVVPRGHLRDELRQPLAEERERVAHGGAVVHEQREIDRLGRARHAQHFAAHAVLPNDEGVRAEPVHRLTVRVDRAHEHRAFATACLCGLWRGSEAPECAGAHQG